MIKFKDRKLKKQIQDCLEELQTNKYTRGKSWKGYEVLIPDYRGTHLYNAIIGLPYVILVKDNKARISTPEESMDYNRYL